MGELLGSLEALRKALGTLADSLVRILSLNRLRRLEHVLRKFTGRLCRCMLFLKADSGWEVFQSMT